MFLEVAHFLLRCIIRKKFCQHVLVRFLALIRCGGVGLLNASLLTGRQSFGQSRPRRSSCWGRPRLQVCQGSVKSHLGTNTKSYNNKAHDTEPNQQRITQAQNHRTQKHTTQSHTNTESHNTKAHDTGSHDHRITRAQNHTNTESHNKQAQ